VVEQSFADDHVAIFSRVWEGIPCLSRSTALARFERGLAVEHESTAFELAWAVGRARGREESAPPQRNSRASRESDRVVIARTELGHAGIDGPKHRVGDAAGMITA
jgi:hypothetical protein